MGCCGEDDEGLLQQLLPNNPNPNYSAEDLPDSSSSELVLSPLNSHFSALVSGDVLRAILVLLPPADLARASCVCRAWRAVASDREIRERTFSSPWKVRRVLGTPSSSAFWRHTDIARFAISHRLHRGDTVAGLALKYSVQVMDIKRFNNMMSDHAINSRERLLIPINNPKLLQGSTCYIELDMHAKREVAVMYLESGSSSSGGGPSPMAGGCPNSSMSGRRKLFLDSMKRSMQVESTAEYYLSISNGNARAAILQLSDDLMWEQRREATMPY